MPEAAAIVTQRLEEAGFEAYLVGGAVRDMLFGLEPRDYDLATSARPEEAAAVLPGAQPHGMRYGCIRVKVVDEIVDVTSYRREFDYRDFRHPAHIVFSRDLREDLARRDFTINAAALSRLGVLVDPFGAREAACERRLTAVASARARLHEDPVRVVRALRMMAKFDMRADGPLLAGLAITARDLRRLQPMRRCAEVRAWLDAGRPRASLLLAEQLRLLPYLTGGTAKTLGPEGAGSAAGWLAALHRTEPEAGSEVLLDLGFGPRLTRRVRYAAQLLQATSPRARRALLAQIGSRAALQAELDLGAAGAALSAQLRAEGVLEIKRMPIKAADLMAISGRAPGPWLGDLLRALHARWLQDPSADRDALFQEASHLLKTQACEKGG